MPSPAGVSAPVSVMPTVTSGSSILRVNRWHASRSRAALYAWNVPSTSCLTVIAPAIGVGSMRAPSR